MFVIFYFKLYFGLDKYLYLIVYFTNSPNTMLNIGVKHILKLGVHVFIWRWSFYDVIWPMISELISLVNKPNLVIVRECMNLLYFTFSNHFIGQHPDKFNSWFSSFYFVNLLNNLWNTLSIFLERTKLDDFSDSRSIFLMKLAITNLLEPVETSECVNYMEHFCIL